MSIKMIRYENSSVKGWIGYLEPKDKSWIAYIDSKGSPTFFLNRDAATGAIIPSGKNDATSTDY